MTAKRFFFYFHENGSMKQGVLTFLLATVVTIAFSQQPQQKAAAGIRQYWFVLLKRGANRSQDSATAARIQDAHLANIQRLYEAGKLKVAGPFGDDGDWRGIFIFDCAVRWQFTTTSLPI